MTKREREYTDRIYEYMDLLDTKYHEEKISGKNITLTNKEFCNLFNFITCIDCGINNCYSSYLNEIKKECAELRNKNGAG